MCVCIQIVSAMVPNFTNTQYIQSNIGVSYNVEKSGYIPIISHIIS
jgi:hypothetical protein